MRIKLGFVSAGRERRDERGRGTGEGRLLLLLLLSATQPGPSISKFLIWKFGIPSTSVGFATPVHTRCAFIVSVICQMPGADFRSLETA